MRHGLCVLLPESKCLRIGGHVFRTFYFAVCTGKMIEEARRTGDEIPRFIMSLTGSNGITRSPRVTWASADFGSTLADFESTSGQLLADFGPTSGRLWMNLGRLSADFGLTFG